MTRGGPFFRPRIAFSAGRDPGRGEAARFAAEFLPHMNAAYAFARWLARDAVAAEDIVQDAYLRAFRAFGSHRGGSPRAWLLAIVRNCFLDHRASAKRGGDLIVEAGDLSPSEADALANVADAGQASPEEALIARGRAISVREAIEALPEPFREALVLREMDELSYKEIAAVTGAPIGTVMSRLARARQMLADALVGEAAGAIPVRIGTVWP
jgi:RNA polymerase sigma-70 factor (ECF subfamily)